MIFYYYENSNKYLFVIHETSRAREIQFSAAICNISGKKIVQHGDIYHHNSCGFVVVDIAVVCVVVLLDDEGSPLVSMWDAAAAWHGIIPMFSPCNKLYINMN